MSRKLGVALLVLVAITAWSSLIVAGCFDIKDVASIEVVLNKPGVAYDLSVLESNPKVVKVKYIGFRGGDYAYLYRSHIDRHLVVIVSLQEVPPVTGYYLAIRVESPLKEVYVPVTMVSVELSNVSINIEEFIERIKRVEELYLMKVKIGYKLTGEDRYVRAVLRKDYEGTEVSIFISLVRGKLFINAYIRGEVGSVKYEEIINEVKEVIKYVLEDLYNEESLKVRESTETIYEPMVNPNKIREALIYELLWLTRVGVINGLSEGDIKAIGEVAEVGNAGWNSRLVYYEGEWIPYYKVSDALLIKVYGGCSWEYPPEKIPQEPPEPTETVMTTLIPQETTTYVHPHTTVPTSTIETHTAIETPPMPTETPTIAAHATSSKTTVTTVTISPWLSTYLHIAIALMIALIVAVAVALIFKASR
ncbi:MAG: hypothetical protein B6U85_05730 [Desulfurococcales archaeon ex4484_42]|nr:MAG: hypothetical protein B6U85_05730 [Desulfurococcales archaeon ex4484_42]